MNTLFDYGEFLLCIGPIFLIIAAVGLVLLANSWPQRERKISIRETVKDDGSEFDEE